VVKSFLLHHPVPVRVAIRPVARQIVQKQKKRGVGCSLTTPCIYDRRPIADLSEARGHDWAAAEAHCWAAMVIEHAAGEREAPENAAS
jgi:hypothetical protein